ncbi:MAG TPA: TolC family protein [Candidatus Binatia bacterium]|nr:TolC family protein [Candidatus Binatia bacterium]
MKRFVAVATALLFGSIVPTAAFAESAGTDFPIPSFQEQLRKQWTRQDVEPKPEPRSYLETRDDAVERLSLREAVATALQNNPGIAVERLGPEFARADVDRANGIFDPTFQASGSVDRSVVPASSVLQGAQVVRQKDYVYALSLQKLLRSGATFTIAGTSTETDTNSNFYGLRPQYVPNVLFTLSQPLLKNFGVDLTILLVRSAEANSSVAYYQYLSRTVALVRQVVEAYWGVVQTKENLSAEEDGLRLAQTLVRENQARVRAGTLPPVAVKEAEADAASREGRVIAAENAVSIASDTLRLLLQQNPEGTFVPRPIEPTDSPEIRDVAVDEQEILVDAVEQRPEVLQARYDIENRKILAKINRNNLLPGLNLNTSYGLNGLSGRGVPLTDPQTGQTVVTPFTGNYGKSLDRLTSGDFNSYSAGLSFTLPLGNTTAEAEYVQSQIDLRRGELSYRQLLANVTLEARKAIGDVRSNSKRITATRLARELAQENLDQQKKRYDVGLATTKDILDFQQRVTAARATEIQALIDYNVSLAALRQAQGTLLAQFNVVVDTLPPHPTPLWARF